jgi:NAD(P)H dehydrogenase (quinone)
MENQVTETAPTLFVSGASGNLGRRVIELLLGRGYAGKIIAGTRTPERLAGLNGVEVRPADFDDTPGLVKALAHVDRMLIVPPALYGQNRGVQMHNAIMAAKAAKVGHVVCLSLMSPEPASPISFAPELYGAEQTLMGTGLNYTILRMTWYAELLLNALPSVLKAGTWFSATGEGIVAHVTREDVARAAAGALLDTTGKNRILNITGPHALTRRGIANIVSEVTGKPITVIDVDDGGLQQAYMQFGLPEETAKFLTAFDTNTRVGRTAMVSDAVQMLWGTPPQSLKDFLAANRASLMAA